jgi:hypothetical protein
VLAEAAAAEEEEEVVVVFSCRSSFLLYAIL